MASTIKSVSTNPSFRANFKLGDYDRPMKDLILSLIRANKIKEQNYLLSGYIIHFFVSLYRDRFYNAVHKFLSRYTFKGKTICSTPDSADQASVMMLDDLDMIFPHDDNDNIISLSIRLINKNQNEYTMFWYIHQVLKNNPEIVNKWWMQLNLLLFGCRNIYEIELEHYEEMVELLEHASNSAKQYLLMIRTNDLPVEPHGPFFKIPLKFEFEPNEKVGSFLWRVKNRVDELQKDCDTFPRLNFSEAGS